MQMTTASTKALDNGDKAPEAFDSLCSQAAGEKTEMKHDALFERFSARLKAQVGPEVYASWFGRLKLHSVSKSVVRLSVPTTFLKSWINNRYLDLITTIFQAEDSEISEVEILVRTASRATRSPAEERTTPAAEVAVQQPVRRPSGPREIGQIAAFPVAPQPVAQRPSSSASPLFGSPLDSRFTFDTFVEGRPTASRLPRPAPSRKPAPARCASTRSSCIRAVGLAKDASVASHCQCGCRQRAPAACRLPDGGIFHVALCDSDPRQ